MPPIGIYGYFLFVWGNKRVEESEEKSRFKQYKMYNTIEESINKQLICALQAVHKLHLLSLLFALFASLAIF